MDDLERGLVSRYFGMHICCVYVYVYRRRWETGGFMGLIG